jgi:hypothetical protein
MRSTPLAILAMLDPAGLARGSGLLRAAARFQGLIAPLSVAW